ncbi:hypothetical protein ACP70R_020097 [Stipagrostis hirtigluma subsp. patula]
MRSAHAATQREGSSRRRSRFVRALPVTSRWEASNIEEERIEAFWRKVREYYDTVPYGVPAAKRAIVALRIPRWSEIREEHGCVICLEDLEIGQKLRMMPCHHTFHQRCIFNWLLINRLCPICQFALRSDEEQRLLYEEKQPVPITTKIKDEATSR